MHTLFSPIDNRNTAIVRCHTTVVWFSFNMSWKQGVSCSWASLCQTHLAPSASNNLRDWLMILVSSTVLSSFSRFHRKVFGLRLKELCSISKSLPVVLFVGLFVVFSFVFASKLHCDVSLKCGWLPSTKMALQGIWKAKKWLKQEHVLLFLGEWIRVIICCTNNRWTRSCFSHSLPFQEPCKATISLRIPF